MFDIKLTNAKITGLNVRTEQRGDEPVLALDLSLTISVHKMTLAALDPDVNINDLWKEGKPTKLFGTIGLGFKATTADVMLDDLELIGVRTKKPKVTLEQGDRLAVHLKVQHVPTQEEWNALYDLYTAGECDLSIANAQLDLFGSDQPEDEDEGETEVAA